jgi:hypothetical protein
MILGTGKEWDNVTVQQPKCIVARWHEVHAALLTFGNRGFDAPQPRLWHLDDRQTMP